MEIEKSGEVVALERRNTDRDSQTMKETRMPDNEVATSLLLAMATSGESRSRQSKGWIPMRTSQVERVENTTKSSRRMVCIYLTWKTVVITVETVNNGRKTTKEVLRLHSSKGKRC